MGTDKEADGGEGIGPGLSAGGGQRSEPERPWAVAVMRGLDAVRTAIQIQTLQRVFGRGASWPVAPGAYAVGNPSAPVAICTLTNNDLMTSAALLPGVAIAGRVYTANLGLEKIVVNVTANPRIRFLLLCGRDSPLFHPGQTLRALCANGVTSDRRVIGAVGYVPVLGGLSPARIDQFRRQIELVDCVGETSIAALLERVDDLVARNPGQFLVAADQSAETGAVEPLFRAIRPGGRREPLAYDPKGYVVITLDRAANEIVLHHYLPDNTPVHEIRGRSGEGIVLGLLREGLVSQLSHAGYLGAELAKAETALRLDLRYDQDRPLSIKRLEGD